MRYTLAAAAAALLATACGSASGPDSGTGGGSGNGFAQPAGTAVLNFIIDDSANKTWGAGDLEWKGSFVTNPTTRVVTFDGNWTGPYPQMYDDGPWSAGGHEPASAVAGDHKWGTTVFAKIPTDGGVTKFEYGAQTTATANPANSWIWTGNGNGKFDVGAATTVVNGTTLVLAPWGTTNLKLVLDANNLADAGTAWNTTTVKVKGDKWGWTNEVALVDDGTNGDATAGDKQFTFLMSKAVGTGTAAPHSGLLNTGDTAQFVFLLNGVEYKVGTPPSQGVTAYLTKADGTFNTTPATISFVGNDKNTAVTVP
jgi:hypothetical protein